MNKLKKIKIVESGRFLSPNELTTDELSKIQGGATCPTYTGCNSYDNCGLTSYEYCKKTSVYGYESDGSGSTTCSKGYSYTSCGIGSSNYTVCGSGQTYVA